VQHSKPTHIDISLKYRGGKRYNREQIQILYCYYHFKLFWTKIYLKWLYPTLSSLCLHLLHHRDWKQEIKGPHPDQWEQSLKLEITFFEKSQHLQTIFIFSNPALDVPDILIMRLHQWSAISPMVCSCSINIRNIAFPDTRPKNTKQKKATHEHFLESAIHLKTEI